MSILRLALLLLALPTLAHGQISQQDLALRAKTSDLLARCEAQTQRYCITVGNIFLTGIRMQDGEKVATPKSALVAADFFKVACEKGHGKACGFAANTFHRMKDTRHAPGAIFALADTGCALKDGKSCFLAGLFQSDGFGREKSEIKSLSYHTLSCELGDEGGCELEKLTRRIVELQYKADQVEQNLRDLREAQRLLSDPNLNK